MVQACRPRARMRHLRCSDGGFAAVESIDHTPREATQPLAQQDTTSRSDITSAKRLNCGSTPAEGAQPAEGTLPRKATKPLAPQALKT